MAEEGRTENYEEETYGEDLDAYYCVRTGSCYTVEGDSVVSSFAGVQMVCVRRIRL